MSLFLGLLSIALWGVSELPQIVANFADGRSEGVSDFFLLTWTIGDFLNVAGCIVSDTLPTQLYTAVLYTIITLSLDVQHIYYAHLLPRWSGPRKPHQTRHEHPNSIMEPSSPLRWQGSPTPHAYSLSVPLLAGPNMIGPPPAPPSLASMTSEEDASIFLHYGSLRSMSSFHSLRPPLLSSSLSRTLSNSVATPHPLPAANPSSPPHPPASTTTFRTATTGLEPGGSTTTFCTTTTGLEPAAGSWTSRGPENWPAYDSGDDTVMGIISHMDDFPAFYPGTTPRASTATNSTESPASTPRASPAGATVLSNGAPTGQQNMTMGGLPVAPAYSGMAVASTAPVPWPARSTAGSGNPSAGSRGHALRAAAPATLLAMYLLWAARAPAADTRVPAGRHDLLFFAPKGTPAAPAAPALLAATSSGSSSSWAHNGAVRGALHTVGSLEPAVWGQVLGWSMTVVYVSGRLPQILKNHRRKSTAGLSVEMFALVIAANLTYTLSILVRSTAWVAIKPRLPWLVDACLCVMADLVIMGQVIYFHRIRAPRVGRQRQRVSFEEGTEGGFRKRGATPGRGIGPRAGLGYNEDEGCGRHIGPAGERPFGYHVGHVEGGRGQEAAGREQAAAGRGQATAGRGQAAADGRQVAEENYNRVMVAQHV